MGIFKKKKNDNTMLTTTNNEPLIVIDNYEIINNDINDLEEIKDNNVIAKINSIMPNTIQTTINTINNTNLRSELVKLDVPYKDLTKSLSGNGARRATVMGKNGIAKNANLYKVDTNKIKLANNISSVFNVTSLVVGQYNMVQINNELHSINLNIEKINNFNDSEYRSKIKSLMMDVMRLSEFKIENLENESLRLQSINSIQGDLKEASQLLYQANDAINKKTSSKIEDLKGYRKNQKEILLWKNYQQCLFTVIEKLSELDYVYNKGDKSLDNSYYNRNKLIEDCNNVIEGIKKYNKKAENKFEIDFENNKVRDDRAHKKLLGVFDKKQKYSKKSKDIINNINEEEKPLIENKSIIYNYEDELDIIIYNGKFYLKK